MNGIPSRLPAAGYSQQSYAKRALQPGSAATPPEEQQRAKEETAKQKLAQLEQEQQMLRQQLEQANKQAEATRESAETQGKCLTIAMRIMSGDTVPRGDHKFLSKNNPSLYAQAIMMRIERSDPRKYKQLSEEKKPEAAAAESPAADGQAEAAADAGGTEEGADSEAATEAPTEAS